AAAPPGREAQRAAGAAVRPDRPAVPGLAGPGAGGPGRGGQGPGDRPEVRRGDRQRNPRPARAAAGALGRPAVGAVPPDRPGVQRLTALLKTYGGGEGPLGLPSHDAPRKDTERV